MKTLQKFTYWAGRIVGFGWTAGVILWTPHSRSATRADVGQVEFPVSASPAAQEKFNRAVAMLHSFWYEELDDAFTQVSSDDPRCGMAYWGLAMSYNHPLWSPPDTAALRKGWDAVQKARAATGMSPREKDYIEAIEVFYRDWERVDHLARSRAYSKAMEKLSQRYPEDKEAAIFYALSLLAIAPPADKTYSNQKRAAEILERVKVEIPDHPGVIHYIIHAYDSPPLAALALPAARRYARIAPVVPHAQHMPSHIFTRLGLWEESIQSNEASVASAKQYAQRIHMKGVWDEQIHAMDYLIYAALQCAQDGKATSVMDELQAVRAVNVESPKVAYAMVAMPARYLLERRHWTEASKMTAPTWLKIDHFPWAEAMLCFARGLGDSRSGEIAAARSEQERIQTIHQDLVAGNQVDWAVPTGILEKELAAWIAAGDGKSDEAVGLMKAATEVEDASEKLPLTPGPIVPAREQLGELYLATGDASNALGEFETTLRSAPNRFGALYGAAKAAQASGDGVKARKYFEKLTEACSHADGERAELAEARAFLASK